MKTRTITIALVFTLISSFQAFAGNVLSPADVKALTVGKTVHAEHKKGFTFSVYFAEDGTAIRKWKNDKIQNGKYFFKGKLHCINVGGGDKCATLVANGDGTYKRLKNGKKHMITWTKIVDGKDL